MKIHTRTPALVVFLMLAAGIGWHFFRSHDRKNEIPIAPVPVADSPTKTSERFGADPDLERRRQESISAAAQKWYEELLEKYPRMKPAYRDVPDAENGFLQLLLLAEEIEKPRLPEVLHDTSGEGATWDAGQFKLWQADNLDYFSRILQVAELPDQSGKGLGFNRIFQNNRIIGECGKILYGATRLAFESGDLDAALRYARASSKLGGHLTDIEVPSLLAAVHATGFRTSIRDLFLEKILPSLSDNPQALESWRDVLVRKESPSNEYSRILFGEWNIMMRTQILPGLLGSHTEMGETESFQIPDDQAFFDLYTAATENFAASMASAGPDRLNLIQGELIFPESGTDTGTLNMLREPTFSSLKIYTALGIGTTRTTMVSAAISLQLGEEPPVDPVSGRPFQWDETTRTLSAPEGVEEVDPIRLH